MALFSSSCCRDPLLFQQQPMGLVAGCVLASASAAGLWNEVSGKLKHPATKLSIGQQQRLCIDRALTIDPQVLLFDEPTSALDPISTRHIEDQLLLPKERLHYRVCNTHATPGKKSRRLRGFHLLGRNNRTWTSKDIVGKPKKQEQKST